MKLTKTTIDAATYEGKQYSSGGYSRHVLWDDALSGFGLRVFPSGKKAFVVGYRAAGRWRMMSLGTYPPLTLHRARIKATKLLTDVKLDEKDPLEERKRSVAAPTIKALCADYLKRHAKVHKKTWREDEYRIDNRILPAWKHRQVRSLTRSDIARLHGKIGAKHPYEANRTLALIASMLERAVEWGYLDEGTPNPARKIHKFTEHKRDRYVKPDELPGLLKAIDAYDNQYVRWALWLYLLTGVRKSELLGAKWSDIDWDRQELRLSDTKAGRPHYVPLSEPAIEILRGLPRVSGNPYIIPGARKGRPLVNISKPWSKIRTEAGLTDVWLHDLRRTVGSWLAEGGDSLLVIQHVLNHSTQTATLVYARLSQDQSRKALERHGEHIMTVAGKQKPGEGAGTEEERPDGEEDADE